MINVSFANSFTIPFGAKISRIMNHPLKTNTKSYFGRFMNDAAKK